MLVFNKLSRSSILKVVSLRLDDVSNRLKNRRITLDVDENAKDWLAKHGYSDAYGARAIARVVRTDLLFPLAQKLLKGTIRSVFFSLWFVVTMLTRLRIGTVTLSRSVSVGMC